jgi:hypothetical protein
MTRKKEKDEHMHVVILVMEITYPRQVIYIEGKDPICPISMKIYLFMWKNK